MSKTRIVVVKRKQVIFTGIFAILAILLVILMLCLVLPGKDDGAPQSGMLQENEQVYRPGIYSSILKLGDSTINLEIALDSDHVSSVNITNLDESIATMYPLIEPSVGEISEQLKSGVAIEDIKLADESRYTQTMLLEAIRGVLDKYRADQEPGA